MVQDPYNKLTKDSKTGLTKSTAKTDEELERELQAKVAPAMQMPMPKMSNDTLLQMNAIAKAVEEQEKEVSSKEPEEEEEEPDRIELDELPDRYQSVYYANTEWDNKPLREKIEKRCSDLSFDDLILSGRVSQVVPIVKGRLTVSFKSITAADDLWIIQQASTKNSALEGQVWTGYARLVAGLERVNDRVFPTHLKDEVIEEKAFRKKFTQIMQLNDRLTQILLVNFQWFEDRIAKLFVDDHEQLKNG